mgnify:FL=1
MRTQRTHRILAVVTAAAVLASLTAATVASPASAAKPKCQGKTATIVGTAKGERLVGTAKRDIIVAKGGNDTIYGKGGNDLICAGNGDDVVFGGANADTIWGQLGNDTLNGNAGIDFLAGQVGNDTLNGGIDVDTCYQGTGDGKVSNCELPPPPPPEPPTLVVAYVDANRNRTFDDGDVLIAKIVDSDKSGTINANDKILAGQYPTTPLAVRPAEIRQTLEDFRTREHEVQTVITAAGGFVDVTTKGGGTLLWYDSHYGFHDEYFETDGDGTTQILDFNDNSGRDLVATQTTSPSAPTSAINIDADGNNDDFFLEVDSRY